MVETPSVMIPLGTQAPGFWLPDTISGKTLSLDELKSDRVTVIMFICNHCPYVRAWEDRMVEIQADYADKGVQLIAISSNDVAAFPEDSLEMMRQEAQEAGYGFPYLFDETQDVAKAYRAACTPDFFLFDGEGRLIYRGQFDDSRPGNGVPVTGNDLAAAVDALLEGAPVPRGQKPSIGCNIKWKPGSEPDYFGD